MRGPCFRSRWWEVCRAHSRSSMPYGDGRRSVYMLATFDRVVAQAVQEAVTLQEQAGVDIVSDGEQRRDNFYSFIVEYVDGIRLMSLAELLDYVENKAAFETLAERPRCAGLCH